MHCVSEKFLGNNTLDLYLDITYVQLSTSTTMTEYEYDYEVNLSIDRPRNRTQSSGYSHRSNVRSRLEESSRSNV